MCAYQGQTQLTHTYYKVTGKLMQLICSTNWSAQLIHTTEWSVQLIGTIYKLVCLIDPNYRGSAQLNGTID